MLVQGYPNTEFGGSHSESSEILASHPPSEGLQWLPLEQRPRSDDLKLLIQMYSEESSATEADKNEQWNKIHFTEYELVPQRTRMWLDVRAYYPITGSTLFHLLLCGIRGDSRDRVQQKVRLGIQGHHKGKPWIPSLL
jgi:hypothetical protein